MEGTWIDYIWRFTLKWNYGSCVLGRLFCVCIYGWMMVACSLCIHFLDGSAEAYSSSSFSLCKSMQWPLNAITWENIKQHQLNDIHIAEENEWRNKLSISFDVVSMHPHTDCADDERCIRYAYFILRFIYFQRCTHLLQTQNVHACLINYWIIESIRIVFFFFIVT